MSRVFITDAAAVDVASTQAKMDRRSAHSASPASSAASRPTSAANYFKSIELYRLAMGTFGKDAPRYTIGVSRRAERPPYPTPGPASYNPPSNPFGGSRLRHRFPGEVPASNPNYIDVDYVDTHRFPEAREAYIGTRFGKSFFQPIETPSPTYIPPSSLSSLTHLITNRTPIRNLTETPGPGEYTPRLVSLPRAPAYSVSGFPNRDQWLQNKENVPGPADYSPDPSKMRHKTPEWTVGKRSRLSKKRKHPNPPKSRFIAIGQFVIGLDVSMDVQEARRYLESHTDVKLFVSWIIDEILKLRPDNPAELFEEGGLKFGEA
jgi:hypothetical protein